MNIETAAPAAADASALRASLADPAIRGEQLAHNYRRATAIAPERCDGCARYHVNWPLARLTGLRSPYGSDKEQFSDTIHRLVQARTELPEPVVITVVGAADTGVPALLAHAALVASVLDRTGFVVIDQCDTPLQLCRDFGATHRLRLTTIEADVTLPCEDLPSDLVVVHSLLRFVAPDARVDCLRRWRRWLKPGGRMIVSNTFAPNSGRDDRSPYTEQLRELLERGGIELAEPKEDFLARLDQAPPWPTSMVTEADLLDLFSQAGLAPESLEIVRDGEAAQADGGKRGRMIAVFAGT